MTRHILAAAAAALLASATLHAQLQMEFGGGVNETDLYESCIGFAYGFGKVPLTIGLKYGAEAPGFHRYFYNAAQSAGVYARLEIPTWRLRPCVTAAACLTTFRGHCCDWPRNPTQRCAYIQPGLLWQFHDAMSLRVDVFRFGWWNDGVDTPMMMESHWRTFGIVFTLKMF